MSRADVVSRRYSPVKDAPPSWREAEELPFVVPEGPAADWLRSVGHELPDDELIAELRSRFDVVTADDMFGLVDFAYHLRSQNGKAPAVSTGPEWIGEEPRTPITVAPPEAKRARACAVCERKYDEADRGEQREVIYANGLIVPACLACWLKWPNEKKLPPTARVAV
jgi:hypothetical protein